jgi:hypothetical protein
MNAGNFRDEQHFLTECKNGLNPRVVKQMEEVIKGCKIALKYITYARKAKGLGAPANSEKSAFMYEGKSVTVSQYFEMMARRDPMYANAMPGGKLRYPYLPCVNMGSVSKPVLVPCELVLVPNGQCRANVASPDMVAKLIKSSAVNPRDRFAFIENGPQQRSTSTTALIGSSSVSDAFGLNVSESCLPVGGVLLPPGKLQYGNGIIEPQLSGTWDIGRARKSFVKLPEGNTAGLKFGVLLVGDSASSKNWQQPTKEFVDFLMRDTTVTGLKFVMGGAPLIASSSSRDIEDKFKKMASAKIVLVIMCNDGLYGSIKLAADSMGLMTQCVKYRNIERKPMGIFTQLALKLNAKLVSS